jgi:hypothetical protein
MAESEGINLVVITPERQGLEQAVDVVGRGGGDPGHRRASKL